MKRFLLAYPLLALPLMAAAPQRGIVLEAQPDPLKPRALLAQPQVSPARPTALQPAPLPNRDLESMPGPRAGTEATVRPTLFTRTDTYRGDGFSKNDSAAIEQDRKVKPGVGFNLRMPFQK